MWNEIEILQDEIISYMVQLDGIYYLHDKYSCAELCPSDLLYEFQIVKRLLKIRERLERALGMNNLYKLGRENLKKGRINVFWQVCCKNATNMF